MRFVPLQCSLVASRFLRCCRHPDHPASTLADRCELPEKRVLHRPRGVRLVLADFRFKDARGGSNLLDRSGAHPAAGHASPLHISCDVPLLALRISATWPDALLRGRRHSWGSTLRSFAPAVRGRLCVIRTAVAHLPFPRHPSRPIFAGRSIARGLKRSPTLDGRSTTDAAARLLGFVLAGNPYLADASTCRPARPILPWAWPLSGLRTPIGALARLCCQSLAGRQPPEAASGSYPLVDFDGGTCLKCSGKAIAGDIRGFRRSFSVLRG